MIYLTRIKDNQEIAFDVSDVMQLDPIFDYVNNNIRIKDVRYRLSSMRTESGGSGGSGGSNTKILTFNCRAANVLKRGYFHQAPFMPIASIRRYMIVPHELRAFTRSTSLTKPLMQNIQIADDFKIFVNNTEQIFGTDYTFCTHRSSEDDTPENSAMYHRGLFVNNIFYNYYDFVVFLKNFVGTETITVTNIVKNSQHAAPQWKAFRSSNTYEIIDNGFSVNQFFFKSRLTIGNPDKMEACDLPYFNILAQNFIVNGKIPKTFGDKQNQIYDIRRSINEEGISVPNSIAVEYRNALGLPKKPIIVNALYPEYYTISNISSDWIIEKYVCAKSNGSGNKLRRLKCRILGNSQYVERPIKGGATDSATKNQKQKGERYRLRNLTTGEVTPLTGWFGVKKISLKVNIGGVKRYDNPYFPFE